MRTGILFPLLCVLLGFTALAGCNSHASFPYDQSLCGNGQLEDQEACDFDDESGGIRFNGPLCHNVEGYVGGTPGCAECRIVYEGSCIRKNDCNAFQSLGCPEDQACYFFPESQATGCAPAGDHLFGDRCDDSSQCRPLSLCMDVPQKGKVCVLICDDGTNCPGQPCQHPDGFPAPMGYCPPVELECDPITNNRCMEPAACYFFQTLDPKVQCTNPGGNEALEGDWCASSDQCLPTLTCVNDTCRVLCNAGSECAPEHFCGEWFNFFDYGLCPSGKSCDPVTGDGCRGDLSCVFTELPDGNRFCRLPGPLSEGTPCSSTGECGPGLFCSPLTPIDGNPVCTPLCSGRKTCFDGKVCALGSSDFLPGLCVQPFSCDPLNAEECPSPLVCTIINSIGETACVNPGPAGPGDPCNLYQGCNIGMFCDDLGNGTRTCRWLCDRNNPNCPGGECSDMFWGWTQVGVCK